LIIQDAAHFSVLKVTAAGWDVLKNNVFVELTRPHEVVRVAERANDLPRINQILFEVIRALLRSIAEEENIPPYAIFNDHTLKEIAARIPVDGASFLAISGVGEVKARQYGTRFLTVIRNFRKDHPEIAPLAEVHHAPREGKITDSMRETLIFYKQGLPLKGIADMRSFSLSTICQHISSLIQNGDITSLDGLVAPEKLAPIRDAFGKLGYATLGTVKEALGAGYEYEDLRFVRAFDEQTKQNAGEPLPAPSFKRREYD
jgi:ATP-dependent DNA helicase RecQ